MTQKLILNSAVDARDEAARLMFFNPGVEYAVYPLGRGRYQVVEIRKLAGAGWFWEGNRWTRWTKKQVIAAVKASTKPAEQDTVVTVKVPFKEESPAWLEVFQDGVKRCFKKSALVAWNIMGDTVEITISHKAAIKRGLV